jgi:hypothetical protein
MIKEAREAVRSAASGSAPPSLPTARERNSARHRALERAAVTHFIEELVDIAKAEDPHCCAPSRIIRPRNTCGRAASIFLVQRLPASPAALREFLPLQMQADTSRLSWANLKPDSARGRVPGRNALLANRTLPRRARGMVVFSFSDDWFVGGNQVEGLVWG